MAPRPRKANTDHDQYPHPPTSPAAEPATRKLLQGATANAQATATALANGGNAQAGATAFAQAAGASEHPAVPTSGSLPHVD